MSKETTAIKTPVSVVLYESENAMVEDGGAVIGDFVTTDLANCDAHAINNHDRLVDENAALREMLISAGEEVQAVIGRLNQYESKDFRCDQLDPPELTDMQTVSEIKGLLSKGEGCV